MLKKQAKNSRMVHPIVHPYPFVQEHKHKITASSIVVHDSNRMVTELNETSTEQIIGKDAEDSSFVNGKPSLSFSATKLYVMIGILFTIIIGVCGIGGYFGYISINKMKDLEDRIQNQEEKNDDLEGIINSVKSSTNTRDEELEVKVDSKFEEQNKRITELKLNVEHVNNSLRWKQEMNSAGIRSGRNSLSLSSEIITSSSNTKVVLEWAIVHVIDANCTLNGSLNIEEKVEGEGRKEIGGLTGESHYVYMLSCSYMTNDGSTQSISKSTTFSLPKLLYACSQLQAINTDSTSRSKHYGLQNDIHCFGLAPAYTPIGSSGNEFFGSINGFNHYINNLTITSSATHAGFISYCKRCALKNLRFRNLILTSTGSTIGGLLGYGMGGYISNVYMEGSIEGTGESHIGGLCGSCHEASSIIYSSADVNIKGNNKLGGLVGHGVSLEIVESFSKGSINNSGTGDIGGLIGEVYTGSNYIGDSYSAINTLGNDVGGILGDGTGTLLIINTYYSGSITGATFGPIYNWNPHYLYQFTPYCQKQLLPFPSYCLKF